MRPTPVYTSVTLRRSRNDRPVYDRYTLGGTRTQLCAFVTQPEAKILEQSESFPLPFPLILELAPELIRPYPTLVLPSSQQVAT
jgi:hypothetical protein